jgi:hypothetical protein
MRTTKRRPFRAALMLVGALVALTVVIDDRVPGITRLLWEAVGPIMPLLAVLVFSAVALGHDDDGSTGGTDQ